MKEKEVWLPVKQCEKMYEVSSFGRIRSFDHVRKGRDGSVRKCKGRMLSIKSKRGGYFKCALKMNSGKYLEIGVHKLVLLAFKENPLNKKFCNHINGNKEDNSASNLEWVTSQENNQHAQDKGLNKARFSIKQKEAARKVGLANKGKTAWNKGVKRGK